MEVNGNHNILVTSTSYTGLKWHESEQIMTEFLLWGELLF